MRHRAILASTLLLMLAACGTPQEQCIRRETAELRKLDALVAELRKTLARGYAMRSETYTQPVWQVCSVTRDASGAVIASHYCWQREEFTRRVPVAIEPASERRKLTALEARRAQEARSASRAVAACKATYPEG